MDNITIATNDYNVICSGSIVVPNEQYVEFKIKELRFRFSFISRDVTEGTDDNQSIEHQVQTDEEGEFLNVDFINLNSSFFATSTKMMHLARLEGKRLFFKFSLLSVNTSDIGTEDKLLFYTWYQEKQPAEVQS